MRNDDNVLPVPDTAQNHTNVGTAIKQDESITNKGGIEQVISPILLVKVLSTKLGYIAINKATGSTKRQHNRIDFRQSFITLSDFPSPIRLLTKELFTEAKA